MAHIGACLSLISDKILQVESGRFKESIDALVGWLVGGEKVRNQRKNKRKMPYSIKTGNEREKSERLIEFALEPASQPWDLGFVLFQNRRLKYLFVNCNLDDPLSVASLG